MNKEMITLNRRILSYAVYLALFLCLMVAFAADGILISS